MFRKCFSSNLTSVESLRPCGKNVQRGTRRGPAILFVVVLGLTPGAAFAASPKVNGLELVPWSKKIEENRYKSGRDYRATLKYFRKKFSHSKRHRWHAEVNVPGVKYKFLENLSKKRKWDGINIYELANGKVMMFVLPHLEPKKETPKAP